jgi:hypothetical protein
MNRDGVPKKLDRQLSPHLADGGLGGLAVQTVLVVDTV